MAPTKTNYAAIQNDEIEALRSIYMDDFVEEEARTGAWNKPSDRAFSIKLRPSGDGDDRGLTLHVSLPPTYYNREPRLKLVFDPNLRSKSRTAAQDVLKEKPKTLIGNEMIYEIASTLQDVLGESPLDVPTLEEERVAREESARLLAIEAERKRKEKELEAQQEEEKLLHGLVKQRASRHEKRENRPSIGTLNVDTEEILPGVLTFERAPCNTRDPDGRIVTVNSVYKKVLYRQGPICDVSTVQPFCDIEVENTHENTPFLVLKECNIAPLNGNEPEMRRAIQNLESKLQFHTGLKSHQSIINPLNFSIERTLADESSTSSSGWTVNILMRLADRRSLREALDITDKLDVKIVRTWSIRLIEGLQHYHRHGSAHGSLHLNNILLEKGDTEMGNHRKVTIAKLSDGGFQHDLYVLKKGSTAQHWPIGWTAPEAISETLGADPIPATDVWNFGLCFLQMAFGLGVLSDHQSPTTFLEEVPLTKSLEAMLRQIFSNDAKKRPSAWDLLHFEFFRNDDTLFARTASSIEGSILGGSSLEFVDSHRLYPRRDSHTGASSSRYTTEFVEEGRLGRGGFGEVFRARNKVDGQPYAIKKIKARSKSALDPILSEVTVLSRLNHPHVVRYYAAWIDDQVFALRDMSISSEDEYSSSVTKDGGRHILPTSSRGLDFISSNNAGVVFADVDADEGSSTEGEGEDNSDEGEEDLAMASAGNDHGVEAEGGYHSQYSTVLYIQMEYCKPETLRDLINSGLHANVTECWRLFRQIVQGLAHIHALSIVHRDLKPENIFIDSDGDVRIGDFGLARPGDYRTPINAARKGAGEAFGSFTRDVGTASYVAPEVRSAGNGKYNEKADMYSLGIILLEMSVPFSTGMERAETLEKVHKEEHTLPLALSVPEKSTQAKIFLSLTQQKPSARPSSSALLNSGEIPVQDEDESFRTARRLLSDRSSHHRTQFIKSLFAKSQIIDGQVNAIGSITADPMQTITLLEDARAMSRSLPNDLDLQSMVKETLISVFRLHGAAERTDSPVLFPYNHLYPPEDVVQFLNPNGKIMQLPYDLILPNAMLLAQHSRPEHKTFIFENVYRVDQFKDQPRIFGEVNFDIVSGNSLNLAVGEAEMLKVVNEILDAFPNLSSVQMCYHINHSHILETILNFCNIESSKRPAAKETISKLHTGEWTWAKVRYELRGPSIAIAATSLDELERFDFRDNWDKAIPKLRSLLGNTVDLEAAFAHLQAVIIHGIRFGVKHMMHWLKKAAKSKAKRRPQHLLYSTWRKRRCDVLVDSFDQGLLDSVGISILNELWANSISAELAESNTDEGVDSLHTKTEDTAENHSWVILIKSEELVKVKSTDRKDETEVRVSELAGHLRTEIRERDRLEGRASKASMLRQPSQQDTTGPEKDREVDVKILMSQTKGKKVNRKTVVEEAQQHKAEYLQSCADSPIVAIETKDDIFEGIIDTRLSDPESWRKFIQNAPPGERQYLGQLQNLLKAMAKEAKEGNSTAIVYNFRTKACISYNLGRVS